MVEHYTKNGGTLPYDPWTTHSISVSELESCAKAQGTTFRQGDILILRVGFIQKYNRESNEARAALAERPETLCVDRLLKIDALVKSLFGLNSAGIEQSEDMKRFLWYVFPRVYARPYRHLPVHRDNHFAAIASDQPSLEVRLSPYRPDSERC